jgi:hypothetical protein
LASCKLAEARFLLVFRVDSSNIDDIRRVIRNAISLSYKTKRAPDALERPLPLERPRVSGGRFGQPLDHFGDRRLAEPRDLSATSSGSNSLRALAAMRPVAGSRMF